MAGERRDGSDVVGAGGLGEPGTGQTGSFPGLQSPSLGAAGGAANFATGHRTFASDEVVAGRYHIVRLIAVGGSGEVYEADDLDLKQKLALKVLRPEIAADARAVEMLRREVKLARRVSHPNVCRVHDVLQHVPATGGSASATVLTMELLPGASLAERLQAVGRMTMTEALPIVEQVAAGLDAAHAVGIVHRDFKSANVIVVEEPDGLRAVVTDFGIARSTAIDIGTLHEFTGASGLLGTPAYMAPEQVEGGEVTPATDIYALGVVMYQMVTGARPFAGDTPLAEALQRLKKPPPSPRELVPELDPKWDAVILRCLERDPGRRFASAGDVARALRGEAVSQAPRRVRTRHVMLAAALGASVLLAAISVFATRDVPVQRSAESERLYVEGLAKLRDGEMVIAKNLFEAALSDDPEHALARSALAETLWSLGEEREARLQAIAALGSAHGLTHDDGLLVQARNLMYRGNKVGAVTLHQRLFDLRPDDLEQGLRLLEASFEVRTSQEPLAIAAALRRLPAPACNDARIDIMEARHVGSLDPKQWDYLSGRAGGKAQASGQVVLRAQALMQQGWANEKLDRLPQAAGCFNAAATIFAGSGMWRADTWAKRSAASTLGRVGQLTTAEVLATSALAIQRFHGDRRNAASTLTTLGEVSAIRGELVAAEALLKEAAALRVELELDTNDLDLLRASVLVAQGDLAGAMAIEQEHITRGMYYFYRIRARTMLAGIRLHEGKLDLAAELQDLALGESQEQSYLAGEADALFGWANVLLARDDLAGSEAAHVRALELHDRMGQRLHAQRCRVAIAALAIERGKPAAAEDQCRQSAEAFASEGCIDDEASALAVLVFAEFAQGKTVSLPITERLATLAAQSQSLPSRLSSRIVLARAHASSRSPTDVSAALADLEAVLAEATRTGFFDIQLDARLALGELELQRDRTKARAALRTLVADARAAGFALIARKASALL